MKLQRSTVVLVAAALLLGGVVLFTQARQSGSNRPTAAQDNSETTPVYEFEETDVVFLSIETAEQTVVFEKDDAGFWQMVEPSAQPAEEAAIAFLLSRLVTDGLVQTTTIDAANQSEFGLADPFATVELTLEDGTSHTLILGDADFSGQNYYALVDPDTFPLAAEAGEVEVAIVTQNIRNGVDRPLEEWQTVVDEDAAESDADADTEEAAEDAAAESEEAAPTDATEDNTDTNSEDEEAEPAGTDSEESDPDAENSDTTDGEDTSSKPEDVDGVAVKTLSESEDAANFYPSARNL